MPFEIVRNDITKMRVDAIVNTANPRPAIGSGVDAIIHHAAGPELLTARERIGRIGVGEAAITPGFALQAKYVIHTVGPVWRGGLFGETKLLRSCYESSLALALGNGCASIAFPLISSGNYGFPKDKALQVAMNAIQTFLDRHEMMVYLVVFDRDSFRVSEKLFLRVSSFIDENYVRQKPLQQFGPTVSRQERMYRQRSAVPKVPLKSAPMAAAPDCIPIPQASLAEFLAETDTGFLKPCCSISTGPRKRIPKSTPKPTSPGSISPKFATTPTISPQNPLP